MTEASRPPSGTCGKAGGGAGPEGGSRLSPPGPGREPRRDTKLNLTGSAAGIAIRRGRHLPRRRVSPEAQGEKETRKNKKQTCRFGRSILTGRRSDGLYVKNIHDTP